MAFCFSGSLLRANFNIVFFLFYIVIVRGKEISSSFFFILLQCPPVMTAYCSDVRQQTLFEDDIAVV